MTKDYSETVFPEFPLMLTYIMSASIITTLVLSEAAVAGTDSAQEGWAFLPSVFAGSLVVMAAIICMTTNIKIRIKDMRQFSGSHAATLVLRYPGQSSKTYIPLHLIEDVQEVSFDPPWWNTSITEQPTEASTRTRPKSGLKTFFHVRDHEDPIPIGGRSLYGYSGPGLLVTYRAPTMTSGGKELLWKCRFATRNPNRLKSILAR